MTESTESAEAESTEAESPEAKPSFHQVVLNFVHKISSIHDGVPTIMILMWASRKAALEKKSKFLEQYGNLIEEDDQGKRYSVPLPYSGKIRNLDKKSRLASTVYERLPNTFLVSFVSEYDAFLGRLIRGILSLKPEILNASEKNISFSDLLALDSLESAREQLVEREVESILRRSHADHFSWMERTLGVTLTKGLESWPTFIELTERRNLFVHCDGIVSSQYLSVCAKHGVDISHEISVGYELDAPREYLNRAYQCLVEISVKLTQVVWRKLLPDDLDSADGSLNSFAYDMLQEMHYKPAAKLLEFATGTLKKWGSDASRRMFVINLAQAYYHQGDKDRSREVLDSEDWSSCSDVFGLCHSVLIEDYDLAVTLMEKIGDSGDVGEREYIDWPIFREFRKQEIFSTTYQKVFGVEPVNLSDLEAEPNQDGESGEDDQSAVVH